MREYYEKITYRNVCQTLSLDVTVSRGKEMRNGRSTIQWKPLCNVKCKITLDIMGKLLLELSKGFNKKILILLSCDYCAVLIIHRYRKLPVFSQSASFIVFLYYTSSFTAKYADAENMLSYNVVLYLDIGLKGFKGNDHYFPLCF